MKHDYGFTGRGVSGLDAQKPKPGLNDNHNDDVPATAWGADYAEYCLVEAMEDLKRFMDPSRAREIVMDAMNDVYGRAR